VGIISGNKAPDLSKYSAIILAVSHHEFKTLKIQKSASQVVFDVKGFLKKSDVDARL
jgi:UDP-N-acetyl-D-galactosamine dehydrogenase